MVKQLSFRKETIMTIEFEVDYDYCDEVEKVITDTDLRVTEHLVDPGADGFDYWMVDACGTNIGQLLSKIESSTSPNHIRITIK